MADNRGFMINNEPRRVRDERLRSQLDAERATFIPTWRDCGDYLLNRRTRFYTADVNRGDRRSQKIIDSTATFCVGTLRAGMMSGITSPARPWKRITTPDPDLAEFGKVKEWLYTVNSRMDSVFRKSNIYNVLPITYGDAGVFATGAQSLEEDFDNVIRSQSFPIGSYMISRNYRGMIDTFIRDFRMTIRQLVEQFGNVDPETGAPDWSNFSVHVKNAYDRGDYEMWIDVCHLIKPNELYNPRKLHSKYKRYRSCYYERGNSSSGTMNYLGGVDNDRYLREMGYDYFPILVPRWEVTGEDSYGTTSPGIIILPDVKQLQLMERRTAQAIEKKINPPMTGPTSLRNQKTSILPGDTTFADVREGQQGFRPAHEVNLSLVEIENKMEQIRGRIREGMFEKLFLAFTNTDRRDITAREVQEVHEERLVALGPVYEQTEQDLLHPLIDDTFQIMLRQSNFEEGTGLIPPPPEELQGMDLKIEYISQMAQAQKLIGIAGIERFMAFAGQLAEAHPEVADKIDIDQTIDIYGEMTSIPPGIIRTDEVTAQIRDQRAKAQAAQNQAELIRQGAGAARELSQADTSGDNALTRLIKQGNGGQAAPQ